MTFESGYITLQLHRCSVAKSAGFHQNLGGYLPSQRYFSRKFRILIVKMKFVLYYNLPGYPN